MSSSDATSAPGRGAVLWRFVQKSWSWVLLLAAAGYLLYTVNPPAGLTERSDPAPDFALTTAEGERFRLSEHRGEVVVLSFWATWCPACRTELPFKQRAHEAYADEPVRFVGVSLDEEGLDRVREFSADRTLTFTQVADHSGLLQQFGGEGAIPATFLIDREGTIRFQHEGFLASPALHRAIEQLLSE